jgi:hypothetical protein
VGGGGVGGCGGEAEEQDQQKTKIVSHVVLSSLVSRPSFFIK